MPQLPDLTRPIMRRAASLNADQTRRWGLEERQHFRPLQLPLQYCLASCIDAVQLEDMLGDVQTDCGNLHGGGSFSSLHSTARAWHIDAVRGRPPHQILTISRLRKNASQCGSASVETRFGEALLRMRPVISKAYFTLRRPPSRRRVRRLLRTSGPSRGVVIRESHVFP